MTQTFAVQFHPAAGAATSPPINIPIDSITAIRLDITSENANSPVCASRSPNRSAKSGHLEKAGDPTGVVAEGVMLLITISISA
jgi:hypothetical protein